jgi:hypothetical protein
MNKLSVSRFYYYQSLRNSIEGAAASPLRGQNHNPNYRIERGNLHNSKLDQCASPSEAAGNIRSSRSKERMFKMIKVEKKEKIVKQHSNVLNATNQNSKQHFNLQINGVRH